MLVGSGQASRVSALAHPLTSRRAPRPSTATSRGAFASPVPRAPTAGFRRQESSCRRLEEGWAWSEGAGAAFAGAHADHLIHRGHPHLAVADLAAVRGLDQRTGDGGDVGVRDEHLHPQLGHQIDSVLGAAVDLGVPALASVAAGLPDGHAVGADIGQCLLDRREAVGLQDCGDELHEVTCSAVAVCRTGSRGGTVAAIPPPRPSYGDSPCTAASIPDASTSPVTRQPSVALSATAMTSVTTPEKPIATSAMITWTSSRRVTGE